MYTDVHINVLNKDIEIENVNTFRSMHLHLNN